jgi:tetratricopeptide (TPR) repeat protein
MRKTIIACALGLGGFLNAQTLQEIIKKTENENFDAAAANFRALILREPTKGENFFYFGENYFKSGDPDSANIFYQKGADVNATNPLNYVGLGKVLLSKGNVADAKTQFYKAATLGAKNTEVMRKTAEAWLVTDNKNADEALLLANAAVKSEGKNPENFILLGDAQLEKNPTDGSLPIKSYKTATTLNPKSSKGILREGKLYQRGRNYNLALEKYKEALAIDANFAPAYREIAELYYLAAQPAKSIENWKKYLELNNSEQARYRFMTALFANKQYPEAIAEYESLKKTGFNNIYLERIAAYSYAENGNKTDTSAYTKGLRAISVFFDKAGPAFKYKAADYKYKGLLLLRIGRDSLAKIEMDKAIALEPSSAGDINSELAANAMKVKKYDDAISYFNRKMNGDPKNLNNNDYYNLGRAYYYAGGKIQNEAIAIKDPKLRQKKTADALPYFNKADSSFLKLTELNPTWPVGFFWRGKANLQLDPENEKWLAKPHFDQALILLKPEERSLPANKNNVVEANEYLGDYYVSSKEGKDKTKADEAWGIVRELDPANVKAKNYFTPPKPVKAPAQKK